MFLGDSNHGVTISTNTIPTFIWQDICRCFLSHASILFLLNIVNNIFSCNLLWRGISACMLVSTNMIQNARVCPLHIGSQACRLFLNLNYASLHSHHPPPNFLLPKYLRKCYKTLPKHPLIDSCFNPFSQHLLMFFFNL